MTKKRILHLTLYRKWFDDIEAGRKTTEYREFTGYWWKRLFAEGKARVFDEVHFRNGYSKTAPFMRVEFKGILWKPAIGAGESNFEIKLGKVLEVRK